MKIDPLTNRPVMPEALTEGRTREKAEDQSGQTAARTEAAQGDVVRLSDRSKLIARAQELAAGAPEVRQAKVDDLRQRIAAGTYNVSGQTVAESMIKKSITEV